MHASLVDAPMCPALLELAALTAARSFPNTPLASLVSVMNALGTVAMFAAVVRLVRRAGLSWVAALAVSLAAAIALFPTSVLTPSFAWSIALAATALVATRPIPALALGAAIAPSLTLPFAVVAAWSAWKSSSHARRAPASIGAAAGVVTCVVLVSVALPALPGIPATPLGCAAPAPSRLSLGAAVDAVESAFSTVGPAVFALAVLGLFANRRVLPKAIVSVPVAIALLPLLSAASTSIGSDPLRTLAPTLAGLWWLASFGVDEVLHAIGGTTSGRIGAAAMLVALPLLQWSHRLPPRTFAVDVPRGHETLTRRQLAHILGVLPSHSALVVDDALSAMLFRASAGTLARSGKDLRFVPLDPGEIIALERAIQVFALPRARWVLQHQGFEVDDQAWLQVPGLAAVRPAAACTFAEAAWRPTAEPANWTSVALVSDREHVRGPVILYVGSQTRLDPHPIDWPSKAMRGYGAHVYDTATERRELEELIGVDGAPAGDLVFASPYVTRFELWRVPGGPSILPVALGGSISRAIVHGQTRGDERHLRVCPSFPRDVTRLEAGAS